MLTRSESTVSKSIRKPTDVLTTPDLSLEFLMGRALDNAMLNVGMEGIAKGKPSHERD